MIDSVLLVIIIASVIIGALSGSLGVIMVLRKRSLLGDAISHATLPGVAIAYLIFGKDPLFLIAGATCAGVVGVALVVLITNTTRLRVDVVMGMMLAVFFGVGMVLLTYIQKLPTTGQAGLQAFIFGQAAAVVWQDVYVISALGLPIVCVVGIAWPIIHAFCFDHAWLHARGLSSFVVDLGVMFCVSVVIAMGLPIVGALLMSALLIAPAIAARPWSTRMSHMMIIAGGIGAVCGVVGALISSAYARIPTGPTIVFLSVVIALLSHVIAMRYRSARMRSAL